MKLHNAIPTFLAIAVTISLAVAGCAPAFEPETDMTIEQTGVRANAIADLAESLIPAEEVTGVGNQFDRSGPTSGMDVDPRGTYRSWGVSRTLILTAGSPNVEFFTTAVDELAAQGWKPYADKRTTELAARLRNDAEPGFSLHMTTGEVDPSTPGQIVITVYGPVVETGGRPL